VTAVGLDEVPAIGRAAITLGVFDGVHRGHRAVADATRAAARARDAAAVAVVFDPHPAEVLRPGSRVPRLAPPAMTLGRLREAGFDVALVLRFDDRLRNLEPEAFLGALAPGIDIAAIVMAPDSAFGRGRAGTIDRVRAIGQESGFDVVAVEPVRHDGEPVSSSRIRRALVDADIAAATEMMGCPPVLRGHVVSGDRRGRELGFPTANLAFAYEPALPALGIYAGRVAVPARGIGPGHPALVSVGVRPTFHDDGRVLVEVYLLDWDGDLYDAEMTVDVVAHLRPERRFDSVDALVEQMRRDEAEARAVLGLGPERDGG
jgi:riboflavin kinase / FMN adenylyltransferase